MVVVAGLFLLGKAAAIRAEGLAWQEAESARFDLVRTTSSSIAAPQPGEALARLRVDRLGLEVMVAEGSDEATGTASSPAIAMRNSACCATFAPGMWST
jgi:hypothetical protein